MAETGYSNPAISRQSDSSSHSNGSFGSVFAVLAVIVIISGVACVLGRLCSKRRRRAKASDTEIAATASKNGLGPKEWQKPNFSMTDGDIEFGFGNKNPSTKKGGGPKSKPNKGEKKQQVKFAENV